MGSRHFLCWLGPWPLSQGIGNLQPWGGPSYTLTTPLGQRPRLGSLSDLERPKWPQHPPSGSLNPPSSFPSRDYLHFLLKQKSKQSIYYSIISDHKTNTCSLVIWKIGKGTKKKIKVTNHFPIQRQLVMYL